MKKSPGRPALVIANGDLPPRRVVLEAAREARAGGGLIVCADGGARHAARLRVRPDVILGDLDSAPAHARRAFPRAMVLRFPDQETTDLDKAIRWCIGAGCGSIVVLGAIGDRIDHSTGALGCLKKFGRAVRLTLLDRSGELRILARSEAVRVRSGDTFSLIPLGRVRGVVLRGAEYPLRGESLEAGVREGISNRATGKILGIRHRSGTLLLYRLRRPGRRNGGRR